MPSSATYEIIFMGGIPETRRSKKGAPSDAWICETGARLKAQFAARYFPSRRGWIVFDLRKARKIRTASRYDLWVGHDRLQTVCPNEDAAAMLAYHAAARCLELDIS